jgi:hypothetical protein
LPKTPASSAAAGPCKRFMAVSAKLPVFL